MRMGSSRSATGDPTIPANLSLTYCHAGKHQHHPPISVVVLIPGGRRRRGCRSCCEVSALSSRPPQTIWLGAIARHLHDVCF